MKIAYRHFLLCILLLSGCLSTAFAKDHVVWRLGEKDGFCREFALHDVAYSDFSKRYTCVTTICQIGTDDSRKIPCAFPGPKDVWAGKQSGELLGWPDRSADPGAVGVGLCGGAPLFASRAGNYGKRVPDESSDSRGKKFQLFPESDH